MKIFDLSENQIEHLPKELGELENLEQLFLRQNKLKDLPYLSKSLKLKV
jgi:Leucine-rich repeat (LRR) protein